MKKATADDLTQRNAGMSRRQILQTLFGATGLNRVPFQGMAAPRPRRPPFKQPPVLLGETDGVLRWSQGVEGQVTSPWIGSLHFNGAAILIYSVGDYGVMMASDLNSGGGVINYASVKLAEGVTFLNKPVAVPAFNSAIALTSDYHYGVTYRRHPASGCISKRREC